ncbi:MAG: PAS domain S-box protein [Deltaproteobacteria bacterium]|nr:PAS domain S-box protein [Deltaproteobacteria bacterium]
MTRERTIEDEYFRNLFMDAPFAYQSLDEDGKFIEVNNAWTEMMGYSHDEVIGKWFGSFLDPESGSQELFSENFPCFKERFL